MAHTPTPLQPLRRLHAERGGPLIWLKRDDMTGSILSGNKVRKLEFIAAKAKSGGFTALITCGGMQSNHCRATAFVAAQLGLKCHLILRGEPADKSMAEGNLLLNRLSGCSISFHSTAEYNAHLPDLFAAAESRLQDQGFPALKIPTGGSNGDGIWGYIAASEELCSDFRHHHIQPRSLVVATGSGGTQAGLIAGMSHFVPQLSVYGVNVCDDAAYFHHKIEKDFDEWHNQYRDHAKQLDSSNVLTEKINIIEGYVGDGYGLVSHDVLKMMQKLSRLEGVVFDPVYTGKAFHGLLAEIDKGRFKDERDLVFVHTGGLFGLFPYADQLATIV